MTISYKLFITQNPRYLHAIVTGLNNKENVTNYLEDILRECKTRGCNRLLIEEHLEGPRIGTFDVFLIAAEGTARAHGYYKAIAYVDVNARDDMMKFAETVAANRGLPVKVFSSVRDAEQWLLDKSP